uniref:Uncharacterized protein n=1 Tax=Oryza glumipatula TaxID=40148 RepID=A0A0D9Z2N5_9ORYZ
MEIANYKAFVRGRSSGSSPVPSAAGSSAYSVLQRTAGRRECGRGKEDGTWRKVKVIRFDRTFPALNGLGWTWALKSIFIVMPCDVKREEVVGRSRAHLTSGPILVSPGSLFTHINASPAVAFGPSGTRGLRRASPHILRYHLQDKLSTAQLGSLPSRRKKIF